MILEPTKPSADELAKVLSSNGLFPDVWVKEPQILLAMMERSVFWRMLARKRLVGLVWLSEIIPGDSASVHILLARETRRYCKPSRVKRSGTVEVNSWEKLRWMNHILAYCFDELGLHRLTATIPHRRRPAHRLARKIGFAHEGRLKDAVSIGGKRDDLVIWGMTAAMYADWRERFLKENGNELGTSSSEHRAWSVSGV